MVEPTTGGMEKKHWSHHPLVGLALGFLLTGILGAIIGAGITFYANKLSSDREHLIARLQARRIAITAASQNLYLYWGYASRLYEESLNGMPRETLTQTARLYDEALAQANASLISTMYVMQGNGSEYSPKPNPIRDSITNEASRLSLEGIEPLLGAINECVMGVYLTRMTHPSEQIQDLCPRFSNPSFGAIPRELEKRADLYTGCVDGYTKILLRIGTDPEERAWSDGPKLEALAAELHNYADECPSLEIGPKTKPK